ncbi:MAG TPA: EAL domain-containing protein [Anaeromyxobacter sp.]|nr:EAL domain-containing protein [Anaeromyxobacter sp.]
MRIDLMMIPTSPVAPSRRIPVPSPLPGDDVLEALESARFGVQYEALVEISSGETIAHEALARFHRPDGSELRPGAVFSWLHGAPSLLVETELALKRLQLDRAPGSTLFVNLDPDSLACSPDGGDELLALMASARRDVVVEAIENVGAADVERGHAMAAALRARGLPFALDDVGAAHGLISFELLAFADYLKFDRSLLATPRSPRRLAVVEALVAMAARTGARTVLEGVETRADLDLARDLGIPIAQGFLFRDRFVRVRPS